MARNVQRAKRVRKEWKNREEDGFNEEKEEKGRATGLEIEWKYNQSGLEGADDGERR